jgi:hypothetical protein
VDITGLLIYFTTAKLMLGYDMAIVETMDRRPSLAICCGYIGVIKF